MFSHRGLAAVLAVSLALPAAALADQITLKNGDRLTGTIAKLDAKGLDIKTDLAGEVTVKWEDVDHITSTEPLHVTSKAGQVIVGAIQTTDGQLQVQTAEAGVVTLPKADVVALRSPADQAAYEAEQKRLANPGLLDFWSGTLDTGLSLARGNADTTTFNLGTNIVRATSRDKITVYSTAIFARALVNGTSSTTAQAVLGGTRYDFNLSKDDFVFGQLDLQYDKFQDLNLRNVLAGGFGYHVVKTAKTQFDFLGGGSFTQAFYTTATQRFGELLLGETLQRKFSGAVSASESVEFFPNLSDPGQYRGNLNASLVTQLSKVLSWQTTFSDLYLSNPPIPGLKKNDLLLSTGLRLVFGHAGK